MMIFKKKHLTLFNSQVYPKMKIRELYRCKVNNSNNIKNNNNMKKQIEITLEQAKAFYKQGGNLKEIALLAFTENELSETDKNKMLHAIKKESGLDINDIIINKLSDLENLPCLSNDDTLQAIFDFFWNKGNISYNDIWYYLLDCHKPSEKLMLKHLNDTTLDFQDIVLSMQCVDFVRTYQDKFNFEWNRLLEEYKLTFSCIQTYMEFFNQDVLCNTQEMCMCDIRLYIKNEINFYGAFHEIGKKEWERFFEKKHSYFFIKNFIQNINNIVVELHISVDSFYIVEKICTTQHLTKGLIILLNALSNTYLIDNSESPFYNIVWQYISYNPYLSEDFIRNHENVLNMDVVNKCNNMFNIKKKLNNLVGCRFTETELENNLNEIFGIEVDLHNEEYEEPNLDDCFYFSPNEEEKYTLYYIETKDGKFYITEVAFE